MKYRISYISGVVSSWNPCKWIEALKCGWAVCAPDRKRPDMLEVFLIKKMFIDHIEIMYEPGDEEVEKV